MVTAAPATNLAGPNAMLADNGALPNATQMPQGASVAGPSGSRAKFSEVLSTAGGGPSGRVPLKPDGNARTARSTSDTSRPQAAPAPHTTKDSAEQPGDAASLAAGASAPAATGVEPPATPAPSAPYDQASAPQGILTVNGASVTGQTTAAVLAALLSGEELVPAGQMAGEGTTAGQSTGAGQGSVEGAATDAGTESSGKAGAANDPTVALQKSGEVQARGPAGASDGNANAADFLGLGATSGDNTTVADAASGNFPPPETKAAVQSSGNDNAKTKAGAAIVQAADPGNPQATQFVAHSPAAQTAAAQTAASGGAASGGAAQHVLTEMMARVTGGAQVTVTTSSQTTTDERQAITQQIQPGIAPIDGAAGKASGQSSASGTSGGDANGAEGQAGHGNAPGPAAPAAASTGHASDDGKPTGTSGATASGAGAGDAGGTPDRVAQDPGNGPAAGATAATSTMPGLHATAHAAAQMEATAATANAAHPASSLPAMPQAPAASASLPRSLSDLAQAQAAQLYQRASGAEMHIAMDSDALGAIDLRAVVHQGSLSATIGVQRADVQTLLVNELPALQHALAEKNLQVGQISVLAGSVGGGTTMDGQPGGQQKYSPAPNRAMRTAYQGEAGRGEAKISAGMAAAAAVWAGSSGRLSVLA